MTRQNSKLLTVQNIGLNQACGEIGNINLFANFRPQQAVKRLVISMSAK
jgi:hypothetical protein